MKRPMSGYPGARGGKYVPELERVVEPACFVPDRVGRVRDASSLVARDGAVTITGVEPTPDALVHTRAGRRQVTFSDLVASLPRHPDRESHERSLDRLADVIATAMHIAPRSRLERGDVLCIDNYRVLHGRDAYDGERSLHILNAQSADA